MVDLDRTLPGSGTPIGLNAPQAGAGQPLLSPMPGEGAAALAARYYDRGREPIQQQRRLSSWGSGETASIAAGEIASRTLDDGLARAKEQVHQRLIQELEVDQLDVLEAG